MTANVDVVIEAPAWEALGLTALAGRAVLATLRHLRLPEDCQCALLATDDARVAVLNEGFRQKPMATNVLSWPAEDLAAEIAGGRPAPPQADFPGEPAFLGDIALAWQTCRNEAEVAGKPLDDHVTHLMVHGVLHLLGYDHIRDADAALMERLEVEILGELGVPDPY